MLQRQLSGLGASSSTRCTCWVPTRIPIQPRFCSSTCKATPQQQQQHRRGPSSPRPQKQEQRTTVETQKLRLPPSEFAKVKTAEYVSSSVDLRGCPPQTLPEFAVIGRSNVGKSSLINMLTQNNKLAKVSKSPGRKHWMAVNWPVWQNSAAGAGAGAHGVYVHTMLQV